VLSRGEDIVPIFGTKRRTYLEENLEALNVRLSAEDLRRIEDVVPKGVFVGERYAEAMMNLLKKSQ
jgi:aryl-alcohol dehydrogenase-like predicted oxidoreductase